jgi:hypothetical protein
VSLFLATIRGYIYRHTDYWEGFKKYAFEMGSRARIYILGFIKICSGTQKLIVGDTQRQYGDLMSLLLFFKNKESRLTTEFLSLRSGHHKWKMPRNKHPCH